MELQLLASHMEPLPPALRLAEGEEAELSSGLVIESTYPGSKSNLHLQNEDLAELFHLFLSLPNQVISEINRAKAFDFRLEKEGPV